MDKEKILDYVMNSPGNSNRAVLNTMLNQISSGGGSVTTETLSGTIANFFTNMSSDYRTRLLTALNNKEASVYYTIDGAALSAGEIVGRLGEINGGFVANGIEIYSNSSRGYGFAWMSSGSLYYGYMVVDGTISNISSYAPSIPMEAEIVWHPINN